MSLRRMLPFILINILVSAAVVLLILNWWERRQVENIASAAATVQVTLPATSDGALVPSTDETSVPEPTQSDTTENGEIVYAVQVGDTLGSISAQFDVPMADIISVNSLENPDLLSVGQELVIPVAGEAVPELPVPTTEEPPPAGEVPTPIPAPTESVAAGVVIVEVTEVVGLGILSEETVSVANFGDSPVALQGWQVVTSEGNEYTFGQVTLFGEGAAILIHSGVGVDGPTDLYWGLDEAIWESGETVTLLDQNGTIQATFVIP